MTQAQESLNFEGQDMLNLVTPPTGAVGADVKAPVPAFEFMGLSKKGWIIAGITTIAIGGTIFYFAKKHSK